MGLQRYRVVAVTPPNVHHPYGCRTSTDASPTPSQRRCPMQPGGPQWTTRSPSTSATLDTKTVPTRPRLTQRWTRPIAGLTPPTAGSIPKSPRSTPRTAGSTTTTRPFPRTRSTGPRRWAPAQARSAALPSVWPSVALSVRSSVAASEPQPALSRVKRPRVTTRLARVPARSAAVLSERSSVARSPDLRVLSWAPQSDQGPAPVPATRPRKKSRRPTARQIVADRTDAHGRPPAGWAIETVGPDPGPTVDVVLKESSDAQTTADRPGRSAHGARATARLWRDGASDR